MIVEIVQSTSTTKAEVCRTKFSCVLEECIFMETHFRQGKKNHLFFPSNHDFHFHLAIILQRAVFFYVLINNCRNVELCFLIPLHIYVFLMKKVNKLNKNGKYVEFRSCVCWIYTNIINLNLLDGIT